MGRGITARIVAVIREAVERGLEEDEEANEWGRGVSDVGGERRAR